MTLPHVSEAATQQAIAWIGGSVHHVVLDGTDTDGRSAAFRSTMRGPAGSPVHVHDREDETVFLLQGEGTFWAGSQRWQLGAGDTAFLPRGVPHTYLVTSETAELITVCNPAGMETFFRAAGWDLSTPPPPDWTVDITALQAAADACGQRVLGPPLGPEDTMPSDYLGGESS